VVPSQHRAAPIEDAGAGGAWRVWAGRLSGWGVSNLCQPHRKAILAFLGGNGNLPRQDCHLVGDAPSWAPRRGRRSPGIHSGLVRAVFVPIFAPSHVVPTGGSGGVVTTEHRQVSIEDAGADGGWWDWVVVLSRGSARNRRWGALGGPTADPSMFPPPPPLQLALCASRRALPRTHHRVLVCATLAQHLVPCCVSAAARTLIAR